PPHILFPPDFEVYEPRVSLQKTQENHIGGQASIEYIVVPRSPGIYRIPAFSFSYFNPQSGQYKTVEIPETPLNIREGDGTYVAAGHTAGNLGAVQTLAPLQTHAPRWFRTGRQFFLSMGWWIGLAGIFVLAALSVWIYRRHRAVLADPIGLRNKRAYKEARRCLRKGHLYMTQNKKNDFYIELSQALWGFLSHKFDIPVSDLSMTRVREVLRDKGISNTNTDAFIQTLEHCEFERFAPQGNSRQNMAALYEEALNVISSIVKELKA
nr:BatD family protein [Bacteroidales bacterium]